MTSRHVSAASKAPSVRISSDAGSLPTAQHRKVFEPGARALVGFLAATAATTAAATWQLGMLGAAIAIGFASSVGLFGLWRIHRRLRAQADEAAAAYSTSEQQRRDAVVAANAAQRKVAEQTAELERLRAAEADLLNAKREAESAAMAKGEFLATMSHEIRTPLNGVLPILELVLSQDLNPEVRHQVTAALESSREMRRIVNDVLDFSKFESGAMQLEIASMRPIEVVKSVCTLMKRSADAKHLRLTSEIAESVPPMVRGDALRFRQLLTNLLGNAIKFTERGEVRVDVKQVREDRTHRTIRVEVKDSGKGIAPEAASRLFQPFSQADASTARAHGGTGLGLAICSRIIESMGGRIGVESTLGRGATFWFEIPFLRPAGEVGATDGEARYAILLTRDAALGETWVRRLAALEVTCTRVATAFEAQALLRASAASGGAGAPALVLVDVASAAKTAASVIRPILADNSASRIAVIGDAVEGLVDSERARITFMQRDVNDAGAQKAIRALLAVGGNAESAAPIVRLSRGPLARFDGLRVLLVDDIAINRYAGKATLEKFGAVVSQASGGREALDLLERMPFDIVLMDCQMPDVDGFTATKVHRGRERENNAPRLPILAVTANAMPGDRERCLEAGMDDHLPKPIELHTLSDLLTKWTRERNETAAPRTDAALLSAVAS